MNAACETTPSQITASVSQVLQLHSDHHKLTQAPTLSPSLISVLLCFRQYAVAISGDIRAMFHQVRLLPDDQPSPQANPSFQPDDTTWVGTTSTVLLSQVITSATPSHSRGQNDILTQSLPAALTSISQFAAVQPKASSLYQPAYQIMHPVTTAINVQGGPSYTYTSSIPAQFYSSSLSRLQIPVQRVNQTSVKPQTV